MRISPAFSHTKVSTTGARSHRSATVTVTASWKSTTGIFARRGGDRMTAIGRLEVTFPELDDAKRATFAAIEEIAKHGHERPMPYVVHPGEIRWTEVPEPARNAGAPLNEAYYYEFGIDKETRRALVC